ncbi:MAG: hypothetical protein WCR24_04745 [Candidatus Methanomethylophilaceae archaeon]
MGSVIYDHYTIEDANQSIIEPITENMVKNDLKVEESYDANTAVIGTYITTARNMIENHLNCVVVSRIFTTIQTGYIQRVQLKTPIVSISSVIVTDDSDNVITLSSDEYLLSRLTGILVLDVDYQTKRIEVEYRAGMDDIPSAIQQGCLRVVRDLYSGIQVDISTVKELEIYRSLPI